MSRAGVYFLCRLHSISEEPTRYKNKRLVARVKKSCRMIAKAHERIRYTAALVDHSFFGRSLDPPNDIRMRRTATVWVGLSSRLKENVQVLSRSHRVTFIDG